MLRRNTASDATDAVAVRYTSFNYAYNVARAIRQDTTTSPVIYCIGLNFDTSAYPIAEPLGADFLATLANDPNYRSTEKPSGVYQAGQTPGKYYDLVIADCRRRCRISPARFSGSRAH